MLFCTKISLMDYLYYGLLGLVIVILVFCGNSLYNLNILEKRSKESDDENQLVKIIHTKQLINTIIVLGFILCALLIYCLLKGSIYEGHFHEWSNLIVRWLHITFGIAWIGSSFYFISLENGLNRTKDLRDELAGNYWAVHGGGFYYLEKYKVAPKVIPKELHWFKYESYFTWVSGICLLFIVYYFNAKAMLIDPNICDLTPTQGIGLGIFSLFLGWVLYDRMCKSSLSKFPLAFALIGFIFAIEFAFVYSHIFTPRAAFMHFGALIGTIMTLNVFFVIIPSQKAMVQAAKDGTFLNPQLGKNAGLRSLHNNYFTLPVLFIMISNHFPSTFSHEYPWLILAGLSLGSAGIKHYLNLKEKGEQSIWVFPISVLLLLSVAFITSPKKGNSCSDSVSFKEIYPIIQSRCIQCHSASPTDKIFTVAPNGIMYDKPEDIKRLSDKILQRAVITKNMPQNNITNMTEDERDLIRCWIEQGSNIDN